MFIIWISLSGCVCFIFSNVLYSIVLTFKTCCYVIFLFLCVMPVNTDKGPTPKGPKWAITRISTDGHEGTLPFSCRPGWAAQPKSWLDGNRSLGVMLAGFSVCEVGQLKGHRQLSFIKGLCLFFPF